MNWRERRRMARETRAEARVLTQGAGIVESPVRRLHRRLSVRRRITRALGDPLLPVVVGGLVVVGVALVVGGLLIGALLAGRQAAS